MCPRMRGRKWTRSHMLFKGCSDVNGLSGGVGESVEDGKATRRALAHSSLVI